MAKKANRAAGIPEAKSDSAPAEASTAEAKSVDKAASAEINEVPSSVNKQACEANSEVGNSGESQDCASGSVASNEPGSVADTSADVPAAECAVSEAKDGEASDAGGKGSEAEPGFDWLSVALAIVVLLNVGYWVWSKDKFVVGDVVTIPVAADQGQGSPAAPGGPPVPPAPGVAPASPGVPPAPGVAPASPGVPPAPGAAPASPGVGPGVAPAGPGVAPVGPPAGPGAVPGDDQRGYPAQPVPDPGPAAPAPDAPPAGPGGAPGGAPSLSGKAPAYIVERDRIVGQYSFVNDLLRARGVNTAAITKEDYQAIEADKVGDSKTEMAHNKAAYAAAKALLKATFDAELQEVAASGLLAKQYAQARAMADEAEKLLDTDLRAAGEKYSAAMKLVGR